MKKRLLGIALLLCSATSIFASTDPFFLLPKGGMLLDTDVKMNFNYYGADDLDYYQLKETFRFGLDSRWEIGAALGLARADGDGLSENGFTDPEFFARWRVADDIGGRNILDLSAYVSPQLFDSYLDDDHDGAAKGSTDMGFKAVFGKRAYEQNTVIKKPNGGTITENYNDPFTLAGYATLDFIGSTDTTKSAVDFGFGGLAKYYLDNLNSIDGDLRLMFREKRFRGGDSDMGVRLLGGYSRKIDSKLDAQAYVALETHSADEAKTETYLGARIRYQF